MKPKLSLRMRTYYYTIIFIVVICSAALVAAALFLLEILDASPALSITTLTAIFVVAAVMGALMSYFIGQRILAPMGNEFITLVKDTALARTIAIYEITYMGQSFIKKGLSWPLFYTGAFYLIFNGLLTVLFSKLEKKLNYFRG